MASERVGGLLIDLSTNVARLQQEMNQASNAVKKAASEMAGGIYFFKRALDTVIASMATKMFVGFIKGTADAADELGKLSQKVGYSVESLSALKYAGSLADVSMESLTVGLKQLNKSIDENDPAFKRLGVNLDMLQDKSPENVLKRVADGFAKTTGDADKTAIAMALFGKAGADLIPLLNGGADGLARMAEEARKAGQIITTETAQAAEEFNDNLTRLEANAKGAGMAIANPLIRNLGLMTQQMLAAKDATGSWSDAILIGLNRKPVSQQIVDITAKLEKLRNLEKELQATGTGGPIRFIGDRMRNTRDQITNLEAELVTLNKIRNQINATSAAADAAANRPRVKAQKEGETDSARAARLREEQAAEDEILRNHIAFYERQQDVENAAAERMADTMRDVAKESADLDQARYDSRIKFLEDQQDIENQAAEEMKKTSASLAKQTSKDAKEMIEAFQGFGRTTSRMFADMLVNGRTSSEGLKDAFRSMFAELIEMELYKSVFGPLFTGLGGAFGGLLGGGGGGGEVLGLASGTNHVPRDGLAFLHKGEAVVPREYNERGMGGVTIVQNIQVGGSSSPQEMYAAARMGANMAKGELMGDLNSNGPISKAMR